MWYLVASVDISSSQLCSSSILTTIPWLLRVFSYPERSTYMKPCCYQLPHTKHLIVVFLNTNLIFLWPLCSLPDNTAWILTRRGGWSQQDQTVFYLPIFISDSEQPVQSSTSTLTIRVCSCDQEGNVMSCNAEAYSLPASLSRGALIAILTCIFVLLGELLLRWCANNRVS